MRKAILYIGISLDGFIAGRNGEVDWMEGGNQDSPDNGNYDRFLEQVDTILMGYKTYHQIVEELSPGVWPYVGKEVYVFTHRKMENLPQIRFVDANPQNLIEKLKKEEGKDIWICGGAELVRQCLDNGLIDVYQITIIPCILGGGIRLFEEREEMIRLKLCSINSNNGMAELIYQV